MDNQSIERRLEAVEKELAELKREVRSRASADSALDRDIGWLKRIAGSFVDDPDYAEAVRLGRAWRRRQPLC
jgi:hypothetical protein